ncbi:MAG TPA: flagellar hook-length control protein FliK [Clostridia bacterium]|nr:flagellar hook-length control protein FliK [Clostridia bacterium]
MQVTALYTAVENPPARDNGTHRSETVLEENPFSGLLKSLMEGLNEEKSQGTVGEKQTESPGEENSESLSMLMPAGPGLPIQVDCETPGPANADTTAPCEIREPANADITAACETVGADETIGIQSAAGTGMEAKNAVQVPAEVPEGVAEGKEAGIGIMRPAEEGGQGKRVTPSKDSPSQGQGLRVEAGSETVQPGDIPPDTDTHSNRQPKDQTALEAGKQHGNSVKADSGGFDVTKVKGQWPEGKRAGPDPESGGLKPEVIRYDTQAEVPKTGRWTDTGLDMHSRQTKGQKPVAADFGANVINQVAEKMRVMLGARKSEISLQLVPESLGRVRVKLTVTDGILTGRIVVQNDETRALIQSNIVKLQENLERQGIPVSKFLVDVGRDGGHGRQQLFQGSRQTFHAKTELRSYEQDENRVILTWRGEGTIELLA